MLVYLEIRDDILMQMCCNLLRRLNAYKVKNINYINDFLVEYEYAPVDDSLWFLSKEKLFFDFNISDRSTGFFGKKTTNYMDIRFNMNIPIEITELKENVIVGKRIPAGTGMREYDHIIVGPKDEMEG